MTSIPKTRANYTNSFSTANNHDASGAKQICLIISLVCLIGFSIDVLALSLTPNPMDLEWRIGFLQQIGERSIVLLLGVALFLYSSLGNRSLTKAFSLVCLGIGVAFMMSSILVIRDSSILQTQAMKTITNQASQLQTQIEATRQKPDTAANITPEQLELATRQVNSQANQLKRSTREGITQAGLASVGNLIVVGLGLVGLGRFGLTTARRLG
jgi:hypothetical protein